MKLTKQPSSLILPRPKPLPRPKTRQYDPLEIRDEDKRQEAKEALRHLWHAMGLFDSCSITLPDDPSKAAREAYRRMYYSIGNILLGDECPECEELTS